MTMTRDKIAGMKKIAEDMKSKDYRVYQIHTDELLSLLVLAERALEPQGRVQPGSADIRVWLESGAPESFRAVDEHDLRIALDYFSRRLHASQIALPAGPVPIIKPVGEVIGYAPSFHQVVIKCMGERPKDGEVLYTVRSPA